MSTPIAHPDVIALPRRVTPTAWVQGTLALSLADPDADAPPAPVRSLLAPQQDAIERWSARFAQAAVEVAGGNRPVTQLLRHTSTSVYQDLGRRAQLVSAAVGQAAGQGLLQSRRPVVESVHTCWLDARTVEASARVRYGQRSRAVAFRLVRKKDRWIATALEFA